MNNLFSRTLFRQAAVVVAALVTMAALPARAESPTVGTEIDRAVSSKSRAEVRAELEQARRDGSIRVWSNQYNPLHTAKSLKSRAEVRAELLNSRDLPSAATEDGGSFALLMQQYQSAPVHVAQR